jgi:hypothetical protein
VKGKSAAIQVFGLDPAAVWLVDVINTFRVFPGGSAYFRVVFAYPNPGITLLTCGFLSGSIPGSSTTEGAGQIDKFRSLDAMNRRPPSPVCADPRPTGAVTQVVRAAVALPR